MRFKLEEERRKKRKWRNGLSITPFVTQKKEDAGDVEKGIDNFNSEMATGNPTGPAAEGTATAGGMGESLLRESKETELDTILNVAFPNANVIEKLPHVVAAIFEKDGKRYIGLFKQEDTEAVVNSTKKLINAKTDNNANVKDIEPDDDTYDLERHGREYNKINGNKRMI